MWLFIALGPLPVVSFYFLLALCLQVGSSILSPFWFAVSLGTETQTSLNLYINRESIDLGRGGLEGPFLRMLPAPEVGTDILKCVLMVWRPFSGLLLGLGEYSSGILCLFSLPCLGGET